MYAVVKLERVETDLPSAYKEWSSVKTCLVQEPEKSYTSNE